MAARAFTHIEFGVAARSDGHSALKRCAYQMSDRVRHALGVSDFRRDRHEHVATLILTPDGAPTWASDPRQVWQRATAAEGVRSNAQEARIGEISIPRELPHELWLPFAESVLAPLAADGMIVQIDVHAPPAADGSGPQPHVHWMSTMRRLDASTETGFSKHKERTWNAEFADFGGGKVKSDKIAVKNARADFAERMTTFCRSHGYDLTFDARTLKEQSIDREAEPVIDHWKFKAHRHGAAQAGVIDLAAFRAARADAQSARAAADRLTAELAAHTREESAHVTARTAASRTGDLVYDERNQGRHNADHQSAHRPALGRRRGQDRPNITSTYDFARDCDSTKSGDLITTRCRRATERASLKSGPRRAADARLSAAIAAAKSPTPAGRRRVELIALNAPQQRPADTRLAATVARAKEVEKMEMKQSWRHVVPEDSQHTRERQTAFRKRMDDADRTPSGKAIALRQAYQIDGWMPAQAVENIKTISYDAKTGAVNILLNDGTRIRDDGRTVSLSGPLSDVAAAEMIAAARRRGWESVEVSGTQKFRDAMAMKLALEEPPIPVTNHVLPPDLQRQVDEQIAARRAADESSAQTATVAAVVAADKEPPLPSDWLRERVEQKREMCTTLARAGKKAREHGERYDDETSAAFSAHVAAEKALSEHRQTSEPCGLLARITGQRSAWTAEERRLEAALASAETEFGEIGGKRSEARAVADRDAKNYATS